MQQVSEQAGQLALTALRRITDVRLAGYEPLEIRFNPADCCALGIKWGPATLWGIPLKSDPKVGVDAPRVLIRAH